MDGGRKSPAATQDEFSRDSILIFIPQWMKISIVPSQRGALKPIHLPLTAIVPIAIYGK